MNARSMQVLYGPTAQRYRAGWASLAFARYPNVSLVQGGVPSTIVAIADGQLRIIREGPITAADIYQITEAAP